jgi:hypothetical protein
MVVMEGAWRHKQLADANKNLIYLILAAGHKITHKTASYGPILAEL